MNKSERKTQVIKKEELSIILDHLLKEMEYDSSSDESQDDQYEKYAEYDRGHDSYSMKSFMEEFNASQFMSEKDSIVENYITGFLSEISGENYHLFSEVMGYVIINNLPIKKISDYLTGKISREVLFDFLTDVYLEDLPEYSGHRNKVDWSTVLWLTNDSHIYHQVYDLIHLKSFDGDELMEWVYDTYKAQEVVTFEGHNIRLKEVLNDSFYNVLMYCVDWSGIIEEFTE